ncbi:MAG: radical SAM protein, partial [Candidatus Omnitrophica bacterium]|nr:radical SAM protein [Candidatus Omnitrophota bacterium]
KTYYINASTFCMERMLDCQKISDYLKINGWVPVKKALQADLIIISTCSFGKEEDSSSLDYLKYHLKRKRSSAKLVVAGCLSSINPDILKQLGELYFLSPTNISQLDDIIKPKIPFNDVPEPNIIKAKEVKHSVLFKKKLSFQSSINNIFKKCKLGDSFFKEWLHTISQSIRHLPVVKSHINPYLTCNRNEFFYLRISKGCLGDCSYCAKKHSTGRLNSKPLNDILAEFRSGLNNGYKKYYLLTEDSGCYGLDKGNTIIELLNELFESGKNETFQIAISNFNSRWFIKYYAELEPILIKNQERILYIQIPIQSASNTILELMNRHTRIEELQECLLKLRQKAPGLKITTDLIVGFPGESDNDFELTREFIEVIKFDYIDIFAYEKRPNTKAEQLKNHLSQEIISKRELILAKAQNSFNNSSSLFKKLIEITKENLQRYN